MNTALVAILKQFRQQLTAIEEELYALQQERGYRVLVEHAADLLMRLQADGTFRYVSPASRAVLGCEPAVLIGRTLREITCIGDEAAVDEALARATGGDDVEQVARLQAPGADPVRVTLKLGVLAYAEHGPELYAAVQALVEAAGPTEPEESALARFVQLALDVYCLIGTDGYLREANPRFYEVLGVTEADLQAEPLIQWVHPDDRDDTQEAFDRLVEGVSVPSYRNRCRRSDGSYRWFEWTAEPAEDGVIHACARDVTNQVYAELALEAAHQRHQQVLEHTSDAFFALDTDWRFTYLNPQAAAMLGRARSDLLGQILWEAFPEMVDSVFDQEYRRACDEGTPVTFEAYYRPLETWFAARALPSDSGLSVYLLDVTERKQAEMMLERYAHSLEAMKAELEAKSAELERVVREQGGETVLPEAAPHLSDQILGLLSQGVRAPMSRLVGLTSILLDSGLDDDHHHHAESIRASAETLLSVVSDILEYTQIEAGQVALRAHPFHVRDAIEDAMDVVALQAIQKGLELNYRLDPGVPEMVVGDETRLQQILMHLLANAVKFTHEGEINVTVQAEQEDEGWYLYISVRDTGVGIPAESQAHLFEPFSQADAAVAQAYGGTGLGLSICRQLCEMMGGRIGLESEPGVGTTFHFMIRVEVAEDAASGGAGTDALLDGRHLLVVDANDTNRWIVQEQAQAWGMTVHACRTSEEARHLLESDQVLDVALLDEPPEHEGAALLGYMQALRAGLPVIGLRVADPSAPETANGYAAWVAKPLKQKALRHALMTALYPEFVLDEAAAAETHAVSVRPLRILLAEDDLASQKVTWAMLQRLGHRVDVAESGSQMLFELRRGVFDVVLMTEGLPEIEGPDVAQPMHQVLNAERAPALIVMAPEVGHDLNQPFGADAVIHKPVKLDELEGALAACEPLDAAAAGEQEASFPDSRADDGLVPAETTAEPDAQAPAGWDGDRPQDDPAMQSLDTEVLQWTSLPPEDPVFDFMLDIMENCLRTARDLLRHLQGHLSDENWGILESSIHALKSNCQILDVETLVVLTEQVEEACEAGNVEALGSSVRQLVWALEEFQHTVYGHITASTDEALDADEATDAEPIEEVPPLLDEAAFPLDEEDDIQEYPAAPED